MTADNAMSIVGGRNIGDEYFLAKRELNYSDLDLLVAGPVVDEVSTNLMSTGTASLQCLRAPSLANREGFSLDQARDRLDEIIGKRPGDGICQRRACGCEAEPNAIDAEARVGSRQNVLRPPFKSGR